MRDGAVADTVGALWVPWDWRTRPATTSQLLALCSGPLLSAPLRGGTLAGAEPEVPGARGISAWSPARSLSNGCLKRKKLRSLSLLPLAWTIPRCYYITELLKNLGWVLVFTEITQLFVSFFLKISVSPAFSGGRLHKSLATESLHRGLLLGGLTEDQAPLAVIPDTHSKSKGKLGKLDPINQRT